MKTDSEKTLRDLLTQFSSLEYVKLKDIPDIGLYMEQVTSFMERELASSRRHEDDKILTKTMINNYAKNRLIPPPDKKRYSKDHILLLIFIYYMKNILSFKDIEILLSPITGNYFDGDGAIDLSAIYQEICNVEERRIFNMQKDLARTLCTASQSFPEAPDDERDYLNLFSFVCSLCFDIYVKKQLVEKVIDQLPEPDTSKKKHKDKK